MTVRKNPFQLPDSQQVLQAIHSGQVDAFVINDTVYTLNDAKDVIEAENLIRRLKHSDEILQAVARGEVDALMIEGKVYSLRGAEYPYRVMLESMREGALAVGDGTVLFCNRFFADMVELPIEQATGKPVERFFREADREEIKKLMTRKGNRASARRLCLETSSGRAIPVRVGISDLSIGDLEIQSVIITDLTEEANHEATRQRLEKEKKMREELEALNVRLKDSERELKMLADRLRRSNENLEQFAYAASHDLKEPVATMSRYVDLLSVTAEDKLDSEEKIYIRKALESARYMDKMIEGILDYSKAQSELKIEAVSLYDVLDDVLASLKAKIEASKAVVRYAGLPVINGDALQMKRLFYNLINNAIKFRREDPPQVDITCRQIERAWKVEVTDNGIGIEPQYADRIFAMFQRLHGYLQYEGAGIGLAVCKKIVENHGGEIGVNSTPGAGSTFYFTLPR